MPAIISLIISIISIVISLYNFIVNLVSHHRRINIRIENCWISKYDTTDTLVIYISVENKSQLPISITRLQVVIQNKYHDSNFLPDHIGKTSIGSENKENHFYTSRLPINLASLSSVKEHFAFDIPRNSIKKDEKVLEFKICTNRGKAITKKLLINSDNIIK